MSPLSLSQVYISSRFLDLVFCLFFYKSEPVEKLPPLHVLLSSHCSLPTPTHPHTPDFRIRPFPYDTSVLCVHDQGECFRLYVGTGNHPASASSGPLSKASAASERSDSSQPNRLFEAGGAASSPPLPRLRYPPPRGYPPPPLTIPN